jgi:LytR cell envelope-related transcriptional attenuator
MTDLIDSIGPYLGVAAFLGLAILAFLTIQQAREVRRLREWAGRAPEAAGEAVEAEVAVAEAKGEEPEPVEVEEAPPSRIAMWFGARRDSITHFFGEIDRRLPIDPRYFIAVAAAALIAVGVLTSGFGLIGDDSGGGGGKGGGKGGGNGPKEEKVEVAILNATQEEGVDGTPIAGVAGLAGVVAKEVVQPLDGFSVGEKTDAASGFDETTVMFEPGNDADADELAAGVADQLGEPEVLPMIGEVRDRAADAPLALVVGRDDAEFGS